MLTLSSWNFTYSALVAVTVGPPAERIWSTMFSRGCFFFSAISSKDSRKPSNSILLCPCMTIKVMNGGARIENAMKLFEYCSATQLCNMQPHLDACWQGVQHKLVPWSGWKFFRCCWCLNVKWPAISHEGLASVHLMECLNYSIFKVIVVLPYVTKLKFGRECTAPSSLIGMFDNTESECLDWSSKSRTWTHSCAYWKSYWESLLTEYKLWLSTHYLCYAACDRFWVSIWFYLGAHH